MHVSSWFAPSNTTLDKYVASRNLHQVNWKPTISRLWLKIFWSRYLRIKNNIYFFSCNCVRISLCECVCVHTCAGVKGWLWRDVWKLRSTAPPFCLLMIIKYRWASKPKLEGSFFNLRMQMSEKLPRSLRKHIIKKHPFAHVNFPKLWTVEQGGWTPTAFSQGIHGLAVCSEKTVEILPWGSLPTLQGCLWAAVQVGAGRTRRGQVHSLSAGGIGSLAQAPSISVKSCAKAVLLVSPRLSFVLPSSYHLLTYCCISSILKTCFGGRYLSIFEIRMHLTVSSCPGLLGSRGTASGVCLQSTLP